MGISKIKIENIRGIESSEFTLNVPSNNPIIMVAPNGFGKTSIATAFSSLKSRKLEVSEEDLFKNDTSKYAKLSIFDEIGIEYYADDSNNTINDAFDVFTIRGQIKPKATNVSFGGFTRSKPSLVIDPIVLYKTIPEKKEFVYSCTTLKIQFGNSAGKLLINYSPLLKKPQFVLLINKFKSDILALLNQRNKNRFERLLEEINNYSDTKNSLINKTYTHSSNVEEIPQVIRLLSTFEKFIDEQSTIEKLVNLYQLAYVCENNKNNINTIAKYYSFIADKQEINEMLELFNCTWKSIKASKKNRSFIIEFPKADQISNGERDVLCFVGHLFEARKHLKKEKCILIIDEIFDYLDDANLISAQYFLINFINRFKKANKELYPILLTHLDPEYFKTYSFSTKHVVYLNKVPTIHNKHGINNLLKDRKICRATNKAAYDIVSNNYLHFSEDNSDAQGYLSTINVGTQLQKPESFRESAFAELENYKNNRAYDIALVCCGIRLLIEKMACVHLTEDQKNKFINNYNKTVDKLSFAKECGVSVPETHFLLSIIYNECMHLDAQCQKLKPIYCKLNNKVIKNMICNL